MKEKGQEHPGEREAETVGHQKVPHAALLQTNLK